MLRVLFNFTGIIWDLLNSLVQPFFGFLNSTLSDILISFDLPTWADNTMAVLLAVLGKYFPDILTTTVLELFFGHMIIVVLTVSIIKFFKELIF